MNLQSQGNEKSDTEKSAENKFVISISDILKKAQLDCRDSWISLIILHST